MLLNQGGFFFFINTGNSMNAPEYCIQEIKINNEKAFKET
jgi:hypothetical protein